ncbi:hypothetical protein Mapa_018663 [Marchantia paleacea]|nr:hypothetical protein Mapa_018663 [Marchantia paleacea]
MTHANSSRITRFAGKSCEVHGELKVFHEVGRGCRSSWLQVHCFWIVHALAIQSIKLFDHILSSIQVESGFPLQTLTELVVFLTENRIPLEILKNRNLNNSRTTISM